MWNRIYPSTDSTSQLLQFWRQGMCTSYYIGWLPSRVCGYHKLETKGLCCSRVVPHPEIFPCQRGISQNFYVLRSRRGSVSYARKSRWRLRSRQRCIFTVRPLLPFVQRGRRRCAILRQRRIVSPLQHSIRSRSRIVRLRLRSIPCPFGVTTIRG